MSIHEKRPEFTWTQFLVEAFVIVATLLAITACAIAWGVI